MMVTPLTSNMRFLLIGLLLLFNVTSTWAEAPIEWTSTTDDGQRLVHVYFFWSPLCPHCQNARAFLSPAAEQHEWLQLHAYNLLEDPGYIWLYQQYAASMGADAQSIPGIFLCGQMFTGWHSAEITGKALFSLAEECRDDTVHETRQHNQVIELPLLGALDGSDMSLPLFTLIIAGLDAFNPCAFFVLLFLLSMLVHARSRSRMLLIGSTFVLVSGLVYFVFMVAWLNLFLLVGALLWITLVAGLIAITIGILGIKDFFRPGDGVSLSMGQEQKSRLFARVRGLLSADRLPTMMVSTVVLAVVANSYELLCTAGFPMVYTRTLTLHQLSEVDYYLYVALYNVVYVIPLAVIVGVFTLSLGARKMTLMQGRLLKLLSGVMMLELGLVLLINPGWLNNIFTGIGLLLIAVVVTLLARLLIKTEERNA